MLSNREPLCIYYRLSPDETWKIGHCFKWGTVRDLADAHQDLLLIVLKEFGCPTAEVRVGSTIL